MTEHRLTGIDVEVNIIEVDVAVTRNIHVVESSEKHSLEEH